MNVVHLGHACVLVETETARFLIDPGTLASGFEDLRDLDAVFVTHQHPDHLDLGRLQRLLAANPGVQLIVDPGSASLLPGVGLTARVVSPGERVLVAGSTVDVVGGTHALVHVDVPVVPNGALVIDDGAVFHPGDSFFVPAQQIDVLFLPTSGPWLKLGEAVDYLRAVAPRVAVPIHEGALADTTLHFSVLSRLAPAQTTFTVLERGSASAL